MMCPVEYVELKRIDELLQCAICYEYMDTSMITSCSHSYCSLCIRRYLHYKTQCPICSEETFEKDLRKNKLLDEIINQYLIFKEKFVKKYQKTILTEEHTNFGITCSSSNSEHEIKDVHNTDKILHESLESPKLTITNTTPHRQKDYQQDLSTPSTSTEHRIPSMFTPKSRKGFRNEDCQIVTCPVCKVDLPQNNINKHLDDCLKRESKKDLSEISKPRRKPLPKLVLSLLKDNIIRKRLKELGLLSQGDRKMLENRLQRYTILYNAECDKINPRPIPELIKQCEEEENLEKKIQKSSNRLNVNRNTEQNIIEQQRQKYLVTNKDSFDQLIAKIKPDNNPRKLSVKRNILTKESSDVQHVDHVIENKSAMIDNEERNFLPLNSANYVEDSDSDTSCHLQTYSNTDPMNLLTIELASSSNDSIDQCTFNYDTSNHPCKSSSISCNSIVKTEDIKIEKSLPEKMSFENTLMYEEIASNSESIECNVLEYAKECKIEESVPEYVKNELETRKKSKLSTKRNGSSNLQKYITNSNSLDTLQRKCNNDMDLIVEDVEHFGTESDNTNIQNEKNYVKPEYDVKEEGTSDQLHDMKEEDTSYRTKFEKENVQSLDGNIKSCALRKREREVESVLNDEEKIEDKMTSTRKSLRLGLSEAKGFNNESFGELMQNENKSRENKERVTRAKSNVMKKSLRLRSKISNDMNKVTS